MSRVTETSMDHKTAVDFTILSATELAAGIAKYEFTATQVVEAYIKRIEQVNPPLNAIVVPLFEQARQEAHDADQKLAQGQNVGPLHGVPITIKESFHVKGTPSTLGVTTLAFHRATQDSILVERLRGAGAIVLGKTNVPQLLLYNETDNPLYGRTNNPWNLERSCGGSSGGEAAIVAAGGSALGLGSDIGGSLRTPALACGINSLKPTSGRLSGSGTADINIWPGLEGIINQYGPMARSVADLKLAMSILAAPGQEAVDPAIAPVAWRDPEVVKLQGLRIGFYTDDGFFPAAPALKRAVHEAAHALQMAGVIVEEFQPPNVIHAMRLFFGILAADGGNNARRIIGQSKYDRRVSGLIQLANLPNSIRLALTRLLKFAKQPRLAVTLEWLNKQSATGYWELIAARKQYQLNFLAALDAKKLDGLICPPHALPALTHGSSYYLSSAASYSMLYNLLGMPAGVVAATRVRPGEESTGTNLSQLDIIERTAQTVMKGSAGLPIGVQVVGRHWREDIVLAIMSTLEKHFKTQADYPTRPPL